MFLGMSQLGTCLTLQGKYKAAEGVFIQTLEEKERKSNISKMNGNTRSVLLLSSQTLAAVLLRVYLDVAQTLIGVGAASRYRLRHAYESRARDYFLLCG